MLNSKLIFDHKYNVPSAFPVMSGIQREAKKMNRGLNFLMMSEGEQKSDHYI